ncbi:MAG: hypothetical protein KKD35_05775 [Elusimicrobia bacterium]|nr:hypothetical protein [Elusimicrobiota bacterium]
MLSKTAMYIYATVFAVLFLIIGKNFIACRSYMGGSGINACTNLITFFPLNSVKVMGLKKRAKKYEGINKSFDAYNDYVRLIQSDKVMVAKYLNAEELLSVYERTAILALELKEMDAAFEYSDCAIEKKSKLPEMYTIRGQENFNRNNYSEAIDDLNKVLAFGENTTAIKFTLGRAYMRLKNHKLAFEYLKAVAKEKEKDFDFNMVMGFFYYQQKQYDKSLKYYDVACRLDAASAICKKNRRRTKVKILEKLEQNSRGVFY